MCIQIGGALVHCLFYLLVLCLKYSHLLNHVNWIYLFESYFLSVFVIIEKGEIVGLLGANKPYLSSFDDCQTRCDFPLDTLMRCCFMCFRSLGCVAS